MTICRYFAQGTCRFGDRCRFEHIENNYNYNKQSYSNKQYNTDNYEDRYGSNYNRHDYEYKNQRYDSRNYYNEDHRGYASDRYNEKFVRSNSPNNQQQYRYRQGNEQNFGKKQNQPSYEYGKLIFRNIINPHI